ncbi:MAG: hypothetical protein ACLP0J_26170 [Solirubrobacteraceae bacterium]|jgi:hypothetical protein
MEATTSIPIDHVVAIGADERRAVDWARAQHRAVREDVVTGLGLGMGFVER